MVAAHWGGGGALQDGYTPLIYAACGGHADCARLLLDAGADKNAKDRVRASARCWRVGVGTCGMMMMGCVVRQHAICIPLFIFHFRPFYEMDLALSVRRFESFPQKVWKRVSIFNFAFGRICVYGW